ncbi:beta-ketoacyl synthase N-terminal-like domain-containing protein [Micromonospora zhanjiangensis]|uniref:Beta-ketoacyl synthase N-terminal-like domain-containing protein n=1 Tax=Micromonospora zhanjiangensis TaxID=1522057 RepID=A0ABV8KPM0_9ACTN
MTAARAVITGWETHSPLGHGADAHTRAAAFAVRRDDAPRRVPDFEVRRVLGTKGTRSMCRASGLAVATSGRLLTRFALDQQRRAGYPDDDLGLVLATSDNVRTIVDFNRDSWTGARPYDVDPAQLPVTLMNVHAGQCAIWHRLRGPNSTICGSHVGSLLALRYAGRLLRRGRARAMLCGAVEEDSEARSAYAAARAAPGPRRPPGEGCVVFLVESADRVVPERPVLAELLTVEFGFAPRDGAVRAALAACLSRALTRTGVPAERISAVVPSPAVDARGDEEQLAIKAVLGEVPVVSSVHDALGDTDAVAAAFQIVQLLTDPALAGRVAAVTATDAEGRVGCALLRMA